MRAMPSLTDVITPSLASTTGASKLAIRCLRISPISSLRMAISYWFLSLVSGECCLELLKVGAQAVVDDPVADPDHQTAENRRVAAHDCLHVATELPAE